jgi:hypothetical protein
LEADLNDHCGPTTVRIIQFPFDPRINQQFSADSWGVVEQSDELKKLHDLKREWGLHEAATLAGSSGAPLLLNSGKVYGIHFGAMWNCDWNMFVGIKYLVERLEAELLGHPQRHEVHQPCMNAINCLINVENDVNIHLTFTSFVLFFNSFYFRFIITTVFTCSIFNRREC